MTAPAASVAGLQVLLANGDPFMVAYLERVLSRIGVESVVCAQSGVEALEQLAAVDFDLLLVDLDLPVISGLEFLSILRADPKTAGLPIVVTTGVNHSDSVRQALAFGVSDYLLKPYQERVIRERLERVIRSFEKRAAERSDGELGFVAADVDRIFLETVHTALSPPHRVAGASSPAQWMARAAQVKPDYVLLDSRMFGARMEFFLEALNRCCRPRRPRLILTHPDSRLATSPQFAGTIDKAFVPDALRRAILALVRDEQPRDLGLRSLAADLQSVTRQAFGMMTGVEAVPCSAPEDAPGDVVVSIRLEGGRDEEGLAVTMAASYATSRTLTGDMAGVDAADIETGFESEGLKEMANVVAGRLKHLAGERGSALRILPPIVVDGPPQDREAMALWFTWDANEPPFAVFLEDAGAASPTALEPTAGGR